MRLAVSSIAWEPSEEEAVVKLLTDAGIDAVEVAPTKRWPDLAKAPDDEVAEYRSKWSSEGIQVVALQSLLFGRTDLTIFESQELRDKGIAYLGEVFKIANQLGAKSLVYGSPKNRRVGDMDTKKARDIAVSYFRFLGELANKEGVLLCIEPNPSDYGCDFIINASQGAELVREINHPGVRLHLDTAGMTLAKDNLPQSIIESADVLQHFHISEPFLEPVGAESQVDHEAMAKALRSINYSGIVSIEMKGGEVGTNADRVKRAVEFAKTVYGD